MSKHHHHKTTIIIGVLVWALLMGGAVILALMNKPEPEIVHTNDIIEAYKFSGANRAAVTDTVDDLDYYGTYKSNPIIINKITDANNYSEYCSISGLKDKTVEEKINNRIKQVYDELINKGSLYMWYNANHFNVFSILVSVYDKGEETHVGLTFDLNTGDELKFENLFSENVNYTSLLYNAFYDSLSTNIQFAKQDAERRLSQESIQPDPSICMAQYCPFPGETYDSLRALIAEYDARLADIEQYTLNSIQQYLAGEKKFYINNYGPAFILSDNQIIKMELKDNIRYAVYLKNYRSSESLYENEYGDSTPFFTETEQDSTTFYNIETENYLFDYMQGTSIYPESLTPEAFNKAVREYVLNKALAVQGDPQKFRYFNANGSTVKDQKLHIGRASYCPYEVDKSYFDTTFRKAIIDGKNQGATLGGNQPPRSSHYDESRVSIIPTESGEECASITVFGTKSNQVLENLNDIFVDPPKKTGWKTYIENAAINKACGWIYSNYCYNTPEKRAKVDIEMTTTMNSFHVIAKEKGTGKNAYLGDVYFNEIPDIYYNPEVLIDK